MKLYIYIHPAPSGSADGIDKLAGGILESGTDCRVNAEYEPLFRQRTGRRIPPEHLYTELSAEDAVPGATMLSLGGDGTFLEAVRRLRGLPIPILGVNMGRLGFLSHLMPEELPQALRELERGNCKIEKRPLLKVGGAGCDKLAFPYAFNEFTLHRHEAGMIEIEAYAGGDLLAVYRGDGIITATPVGSTAYSLSAGGPILAPDCPVLVMTALAPHTLSMRPIVIPDSTAVLLRVATRGHKAVAFLDNMSCPVSDGDEFTIEKAEFSAFLIRLQNISFYDTLRNKMMWGMDKRDSDR